MEINQSSLLDSSVLHLVAHRNWGRDKRGSVRHSPVTSSAAPVDGADLCPHLLLMCAPAGSPLLTTTASSAAIAAEWNRLLVRSRAERKCCASRVDVKRFIRPVLAIMSTGADFRP